MNWKTLVVFICVQTVGVWCIYSSSGHADIRLAIGWWLLLLPGAFTALFVPFGWGFPSTIVAAVCTNAIIWYSITRGMQALKRR